MTDQSLQFAPFVVVNAFMRPDFRLAVVQSTFSHLHKLPPNRQAHFNKACKRYLQVPGFRNSMAAPAAMKIRPFITAFEKQSDLVAITLQIWSEQHTEIRQDVAILLSKLEWVFLPVDVDRSALPGFLTTWPVHQDFDTVYNAYKEMYPESTISQDDVSLMVVWLSGRLPYEDDEDEIAEEDDDGVDKV